jgi:hypothetical protein
MDTYMNFCYNVIVGVWKQLPQRPNTTERQAIIVDKDKKGRYTAAQKRAAEKYLKESVEDIRIRVPKGKKAALQSHAAGRGESLNGFVNRAIDETVERDGGEPGGQGGGGQ